MYGFCQVGFGVGRVLERVDWMAEYWGGGLDGDDESEFKVELELEVGDVGL